MTAPRPLGYWVRTVAQLIEEQFQVAAEESDLTRREWQLLNRLRIGAVAEDSLRDAMAPFLDGDESLDDPLRRLTDDGLVVHQEPEYRLTDRGVERVDEVQEIAAQRVRDQATDGVSEDDYQRLITTLERIALNLGWQTE
ncbi:MarR family transcriptional regulator [Nocardioides antri]|uniref:MarR family transcriptional regulator n=1 Tax=Nocardioides antri TaxID=2607659 RepID=A0A5B1M1E5_9ACTN|nr:MarR family transcriptional regulator [Nocardioides antri]KAA1426743.1 MarR family transcriptional regulator [Nocardioides antri]